MKLAIIGGTFNPIHLGHLFLAEEVLCTFSYEMVIFIPAHIPAHKEAPGDISPEQRLAMVKLAISPYKEFGYDDCEIRRGGISYTIDTIHRLMERYKLADKPGLVIGDDLINGFPAWKEAEKISRIAELIIAHRIYKEKQPLPYAHVYLKNLMLPISSSDIRYRAIHDLAYRFLVPEKVFAYIKENDLYKTRTTD